MQAQQGNDDVAGGTAGELTELELEEAAAAQLLHTHGSGDAANTASPKASLSSAPMGDDST